MVDSTGPTELNKPAKQDPPSGGQSLRSLLLWAARELASATEARWTIEHVMGSEMHPVALAASGAVAESAQTAQVVEIVRRRLAGEPIQYLLGSWPFRSLELQVDTRVLIPRPETEIVVGHALDELARVVGERLSAGGSEPVAVLDLGTGSGAIALSLAYEGPQRLGGRRLEVWGVDCSADALEVAHANYRVVMDSKLQVDSGGDTAVKLIHGDWFGALPPHLAGTISMVVANPPYVTEDEWRELDPQVRDHEPVGALVSGPLGTEDIEAILYEAPRWLTPDGVLVLEIAPHQADEMSMRALMAGFDGVIVRQDLAGRNRALVARRWGSS